MTPQTQRLLELLAAAGGWVSRGELAAAMGKRRLNPWDTALLDRMARAGVIEVDARPQQSLPKPAYFYRVKGK